MVIVTCCCCGTVLLESNKSLVWFCLTRYIGVASRKMSKSGRPVYCGNENFAAFKMQLTAYWLDREIEEDNKKLQLLPLCFAEDALNYFAQLGLDGRNTYDSAIKKLEKWQELKVKPVNPLQALSKSKWESGEAIDDYVSSLRKLVGYVTEL